MSRLEAFIQEQKEKSQTFWRERRKAPMRSRLPALHDRIGSTVEAAPAAHRADRECFSDSVASRQPAKRRVARSARIPHVHTSPLRTEVSHESTAPRAAAIRAHSCRRQSTSQQQSGVTTQAASASPRRRQCTSQQQSGAPAQAASTSPSRHNNVFAPSTARPHVQTRTQAASPQAAGAHAAEGAAGIKAAHSSYDAARNACAFESEALRAIRARADALDSLFMVVERAQCAADGADFLPRDHPVLALLFKTIARVRSKTVEVVERVSAWERAVGEGRSFIVQYAPLLCPL